MQLIQLIVGSGCGADIVPQILQHLDFKEFVELCAVCDLYELDLVPYVRSNKKLRDKIIVDNYFDKLERGGDGCYPPVLNYERLWSLTPENLLIEVRLLAHTSFEGCWNIDMVAIDNNQRPSCIPLVAFNPVYPVAAVAEYHSLIVVAYAGPLRFNQGQILYSAPFHCFGENVWLSWNPLGTCLLTCVQYTDDTCSKLVSLYRLQFGHNCGTFRKLTTPELDFRGCGTMLTSSLWVNDDSFIWSKDPDSPLWLVTVTKRNEVIVKTLLDSSQSLLTLPDSNINLDAAVRDQRDLWPAYPNLYPVTPQAIFGNLFAVADSRSPYYFCVTLCPNHVVRHECIAVVSRHDCKVQKIINLPGHVIEISTVENTLFVLFSKLQALDEPDKKCAYRVRSGSSVCGYECPALEDMDYFHTTTELVSFTDSNLEPKKLTEVCGTCSIKKVWHKNSWGTQRRNFDAIGVSAIVNATKDFVHIINIGDAQSLANCRLVTHDRVYTNHHLFRTKTETVSRHYEQPITYFYHPTKPFMFTHRHSLYNDFDRPFFSVTPAAKVQDLEDVIQPYNELDAPYNSPIRALVTRETS